jgi:hypothetical protein
MLKIDYFNPVVDDWNEEAQAEEERQKEECDYCLYVITPQMKGGYSIAEVVDDSNKRPEKTVFCVLIESDDDIFDHSQCKSLVKIAEVVRNNGAKVAWSLEEVADYLNKGVEANA